MEEKFSLSSFLILLTYQRYDSMIFYVTVMINDEEIWHFTTIIIKNVTEIHGDSNKGKRTIITDRNISSASLSTFRYIGDVLFINFHLYYMSIQYTPLNSISALCCIEELDRYISLNLDVNSKLTQLHEKRNGQFFNRQLFIFM